MALNNFLQMLRKSGYASVGSNCLSVLIDPNRVEQNLGLFVDICHRVKNHVGRKEGFVKVTSRRVQANMVSCNLRYQSNKNDLTYLVTDSAIFASAILCVKQPLMTSSIGNSDARPFCAKKQVKEKNILPPPCNRTTDSIFLPRCSPIFVPINKILSVE